MICQGPKCHFLILLVMHNRCVSFPEANYLSQTNLAMIKVWYLKQ